MLREGGNKTANAFLIEAKEEGKIFQNSTAKAEKRFIAINLESMQEQDSSFSLY